MRVKQDQVILRKRPDGDISPDSFELVHLDLELTLRNDDQDKVWVEVLYTSVDPAMRGWMSEKKSYIPPVKLGSVMRAAGVARVILVAHGNDKKNDDKSAEKVRVGDIVTGMFGWQRYAKMKQDHLTKLVLPNKLSMQYSLGLSSLGGTALTAYFGFFDVGKPRKQDTVLVSAAAGATGSTVVALAKSVMQCARVVGIAGGEAKCDYVRNVLRADACIDYKKYTTEQELLKAIRRACPNGVDIFFDNVGGMTLNAVMRNLAQGARIVICGQISMYNKKDTDPLYPLTAHPNLLIQRASMKGFIVFDYEKQYDRALGDLRSWIDQGLLVPQEQIVNGLDKASEALTMLFRGENLGKLIVKVRSDETSILHARL